MVCAGAVNPGDVVIADMDGVVVVPARIAHQAADAAQARQSNEADKRGKVGARRSRARHVQDAGTAREGPIEVYRLMCDADGARESINGR